MVFKNLTITLDELVPGEPWVTDEAGAAEHPPA
jgi:hypothetical protein